MSDPAAPELALPDSLPAPEAAPKARASGSASDSVGPHPTPAAPRAPGPAIRKRTARDRLSALNPANLFFGPTFQMEVRSAGRRRGTYIFRFLYTAGLLGIALVAFISLRQQLTGQSAVYRLQALQEFAPVITYVVVWFQFIALALAAPIMTAPAVCDERRARTLGTLLTTPLTSAQIAFGKLTSRLVQLLILALLATPLLLAVRVFGGLEAETILAATAISISTAVLAAALALIYSVRHRRATTAALFALFTLVLAQFGPLTVAGIIYYHTQDPYAGTGGRFSLDVMASCSPGALGMITADAWTTLAPPSQIRRIWLTNVGYNLLLAFAATLFASVALRRAMLREAGADGAEATAVPARRAAKAAAATRAGTDTAPTPAEPAGEPELRLRARERTVGDRPVLWREVRQATFGSRYAIWAAAALAVGGLAILYNFAGLDEEGLHPTLAILGAAAALITSVFLTTGGVTTEREARTWDVLLTTPLTAREIILGKFVGALRRQWFIPAIVLAHFLIAAVAGYIRPLFFLHFVLILSGPLLLLTATGALFSLIFRRGTVAAVCNLATALTLWVGCWIALVLLLQFFGFDRLLDLIDPETLTRACLVINPVAMILTAADGAFTGGFRTYRPAVYDLPGESYSASEFTLTIAAVWLGYTLAAAIVLWLAVSLFPRLAGRAWSPRQERSRLVAHAGRVLLALPAVLIAAGFGYTLRGPLGAALVALAVLVLLTAMAVKDNRRARAA